MYFPFRYDTSKFNTIILHKMQGKSIINKNYKYNYVGSSYNNYYSRPIQARELPKIGTVGRGILLVVKSLSL